ncbi:MAG: ABC-2 type transport system ATP-binding protein [Verrucomicrobiales bacterium]|jgi:ABC-2 type transport system ATP-binding protein
MIHVENVWKAYDTLVAVREVSLQLESGRTLGLIGPNGAGKTTLLRMLATLVKPDRGVIEIAGMDVCKHPRDVRRCISFMPAEFGSPPDMTMREYMRYFASLAGIDKRARDAGIDQAFALTELTGRDEVMVRSLSTGNRQRLLLAKTLINDPRLLILDEPSSGLDPRARVEVREILQELAGMGKTIVISSHILADLEEICSDICIMEAGRMVLAGDIDQLHQKFTRTHKLLRLRVPSAEIAVTQSRLEALADIISCEVENDWVVAASSRENSNFILRELLNHDIQILELQEDKPDLEDMFIHSTAGEVT